MSKVVIERVYLPTETLGSMYLGVDASEMGETRVLPGEFLCKTMELPWKDNKRSISCIPEGEYRVIKQPPKADRPYPYFRLPKVPGRSGILIHRISYVSGLKGCIGVGMAFQDLNNDEVPDIIRSTEALNMLIDTLPDEFTLAIRKKVS